VKPLNLPVANREHRTYEGAAFEEWRLDVLNVYKGIGKGKIINR
jgi:hypothetical protein